MCSSDLEGETVANKVDFWRTVSVPFEINSKGKVAGGLGEIYVLNGLKTPLPYTKKKFFSPLTELLIPEIGGTRVMEMLVVMHK